MAKIALLIGVGEYGSGLEALPGTQTDIQSMRRVLQDPKIGGFDSVELLPNPDPTQMQRAIETLFMENRNRDDLVLLYFSGHGVRDDNGTLYFATRITEKNAQGRVRTSTAVAASALQYYMSQSRSKRQVLILDCCFSGAFANDMKAKAADEAINVKSQLGGEGRAVLTSSTATQVSYEKEGASIYTRYLVQGLGTGAADRDNKGQITIDELHEYAREKVQEAAPTMQPEIYAVREGYKIFIARAPQSDPKLVYRKELDERAKQKRGRLSPVDIRALEHRWQELGLSPQDAEIIANEVLQPYKVFEQKLNKFEQAVKETLESDPQLSATSRDDLHYFQRVLKLRDEDIAPVLATYQIDLVWVKPLEAKSVPQPPVAKPTAAPQPTSTATPSVTPKSTPHPLVKFLPSPSTSENQSTVRSVSSAPQPSRPSSPQPVSPSVTRQQFLKWFFWGGAGVAVVAGVGLLTRARNYPELERLLREREWKEADQETLNIMLKEIGREEEGLLDIASIEAFPCDVLLAIDQLWVQYSDDKFGFSVQQKIWQEVGSPTEYNAQWEEFGSNVGWRVNNEWLNVSEAIYSTQAPRGHLPFSLRGRGSLPDGVFSFSLILHFENCSR